MTFTAPIFSMRRTADRYCSRVMVFGAGRPGMGSTVKPSRKTISLILVWSPAMPDAKSMRRFRAT